jgi:hypothetical protein
VAFAAAVVKTGEAFSPYRGDCETTLSSCALQVKQGHIYCDRCAFGADGGVYINNSPKWHCSFPLTELSQLKVNEQTKTISILRGSAPQNCVTMASAGRSVLDDQGGLELLFDYDAVVLHSGNIPSARSVSCSSMNSSSSSDETDPRKALLRCMEAWAEVLRRELDAIVQVETEEQQQKVRVPTNLLIYQFLSVACDVLILICLSFTIFVVLG